MERVVGRIGGLWARYIRNERLKRVKEVRDFSCASSLWLVYRTKWKKPVFITQEVYGRNHTVPYFYEDFQVLDTDTSNSIHPSRTFQLDGDFNTALNTDQVEKSGGCEQDSASRPLVIFSAGGKGTRIQSLNSTVPKPMIPIAGKPILQRGIENLVNQGYTNFIITVSHMAEQIVNFFGDGSSFGCSISYFTESKPLGNAGALFKLMEEHRIEGSFLYFIADAIFDIDADRFWRYHTSRRSLASLFVHPNSHPYDSSVLVTDDDGRVVQWLNKEDDRPEWYKNQVNAGLQILSTELLQLSGIDPTTVDAENRVDLDRDILKPLL